jgi:hypothetical protein
MKEEDGVGIGLEAACGGEGRALIAGDGGNADLVDGPVEEAYGVAATVDISADEQRTLVAGAAAGGGAGVGEPAVDVKADLRAAVARMRARAAINRLRIVCIGTPVAWIRGRR